MIRIGIPVRSISGRYVVNQNYVEALRRANAEAMMILPTTDLDSILPLLKGILIPGGGDVDPSLYDEENTLSDLIDPVIDRLDMSLIELALKHQLEIFGICRGQQIINVALQGSLIQDIPSSVKTELDHSYSEHHTAPTQGHLIKVKAGSRLSTLLPPEIIVNSYHHQAIKKLAENCSVSALSEDGIIEAIEGPHLLAVQWHPERMIEDPLFQSLFDDFIQRCL